MDTSKKKVLDLLSSGDAGVSPIEGLQEKVGSMEALKGKRGTLIKNVENLKTKSAEELKGVGDELSKEVGRYNKLQQKAAELASRRSTAMGRIKGRMIGTGVALGSGFLKSLPHIMGAMAVTPNMVPKQIGNISGVKMERPSFLDMASLVVPGMKKPKLTPEQEFQEALRAGLIA
jgi:hypothetical protein